MERQIPIEDGVRVELSRLTAIPRLYRTGNEERFIDYYRARLDLPSDPKQRTVVQQVELGGKAPFGSPEYNDELFNLIVAQPDETNPNGNRAAQLRKIGIRLAYIATDQGVVAEVLGRVGHIASTNSAKKILLAGLHERPSYTGAITLEESLRVKWQL